MRRTKEDAEQTRQDILNAALAVFSESGYQAARLQDIAAAAGTTRGAIYHHFQNKADLYKILVEEASTQGAQLVQTAIEAGGTFSEICRRILVESMHLLETDERFRQVMALSLFKTGVSAELVAIEQERLQNAQGFVNGVAMSMQAGIAAGEVRADVSPHTLAHAFLAFQNGVAWLWLANGEFFSLRNEASALADILLNGLLVSK